MPSDMKGLQSHSAEKVKHLYPLMGDSPGPETILSAFFCVEARIDFNDVRTGFCETVSLSKALEIYSDNADLLWTDDMIRDIDLAKTTASPPDGILLGILPEFVDISFIARMENQFVQYLLRSFEIKIYRNFDLNIYSSSGESRDEFRNRCIDLFDGPRRQDLDRLHEVFNRKLEQIRYKYLALAETDDLEHAKLESRNKDMFSRCSERISELFYMAEVRMKPMGGPPRYVPGKQDLDERLFSLELEAYQAIAHLVDSYDEKACAVDEYILHPNLKDIHFVRSCILWMATGH